MSHTRTRFAPSPTGTLHLGGVRTALYSWLYARSQGGKFLLRLEDTDRRRSTLDFERDIISNLEWLGLQPDLGPYRQTERLPRYREVVENLLSAGHAYHCYCSLDELEAMRKQTMAQGLKPRYDGRCRKRSMPAPAGATPVVRFLNPDAGEVVVEDRLQGRVVYRNEELDDLVLLRADGTPTYHLTVVTDDIDMEITDVIRGDDHLNNTPRQLNLYAALGIPPPRYTHLPLILGTDGARLSKRHGAMGVGEFRRLGYLPEALLNYLARLGWSAGDRELYSPRDLVESFDLADLNRSAARFDLQKLRWYNQQHLMRLPITELEGRLLPFLEERSIKPGASRLPRMLEVLREREGNLAELAERIGVYLHGPGDYVPRDARKWLGPGTAPLLQALGENLARIPDWRADRLLKVLQDYQVKSGLPMGRIAQPLRVALCGVSASPPIELTLELVGREATLERVRRARQYARDSASAV